MDDPNLSQRNLEEEALLGDIIREEHDYDGSGDGMPVEEEDRDDGSGERTEEGAVAKSGEVYILIKPVLTS